MTISFEEAYAKLNPDQKQAVDAINGPVLVVAGPGTGKTQVLTLRIANILKQTDAQAENILALTFTEAAAKNMQDRLFQFIGTDAYKITISTYHSFCNEIIQNYPEYFQSKQELTQIDDLKKFRIISQCFDSYNPKETYELFPNLPLQINSLDELIKEPILKPFNSPYYHVRTCMQKIDLLKREGIQPDDFKSLIDESLDELSTITCINPRTKKTTGKWTDAYKTIRKNIELLYIYKQYQIFSEKNQLYDFTDMINFVVNAFTTHEELLAQHQERFLYILVDEFQDSNGAQNNLISLLGNWDDQPNIFAVGDDDQSIFRFQGANIENIQNFATTYPDTKVITITTNYRSNQTILDHAKSLIENNNERLTTKLSLPKTLTAHSNLFDTNSPVTHIQFSRGEVENHWISKKIRELLDSGVSANSIAILYKKHKDGEELLDFLLNENIPLSYQGNSNILEEGSIQLFLNFLKLVENPEDNRLCMLILRSLFKDIDTVELYVLFETIKRERYLLGLNQSLTSLLSKSETYKQSSIDKEQGLLIKEYIERILTWNREKEETRLDTFILKVIHEVGIIKEYKSNHNIDALVSLKTLIDWIKTRVGETPNYSLSLLLEDIALLEQNGLKILKEPFKNDSIGVNMLTAHASKGLEFEYVFIPKCIHKHWDANISPDNLKLVSHSKQTPSKESKLEEERRLFFVALTRAQKQLFLCSSESYLQSNKLTPRLTSQFVAELDTTQLTKQQYNEEPTDISNILDATLTYTPYTFSSNREKEYIQNKVERFTLSATALNCYLQNPNDFLDKFIFNIPEPTSKSMVLGTAIHHSLEHFYRNILDNDIKEESYLEFMFEKKLEQLFFGEADYEETLYRGKKILSNWYNATAPEFTTPELLEYSFSGRRIFIEDTQLVGKIDKVELLSKDENTVKIIDYKTGREKSFNTMMGDIRDPNKTEYRQLMFYALLAKLDTKFKYNVSSAEIEFVHTKSDRVKKVLYPVEQATLDELHELIVEVIGKIKNLEF
jgi:DNA helicase-2/ATP-dependent DNA helicase PcrA